MGLPLDVGMDTLLTFGFSLESFRDEEVEEVDEEVDEDDDVVSSLEMS